MAKNLTITLLAFVMMLVVASLSGCGNASPTNVTSSNFAGVLTTGNTGGTGTYGSLTLSGTGTAATGTTFNANYTVTSTILTTAGTYWYTSSIAAPIYPMQMLVAQYDTVTASVSMVALYYYPAVNNISNYWGAFSLLGQISSTSATISTTARTITFNNLALPSASPASTMVLNGTLKY